MDILCGRGLSYSYQHPPGNEEVSGAGMARVDRHYYPHHLWNACLFEHLIIGTRDALGVVGRYMAGVTVCRVILMYELAGLRQSCNSIEKMARLRCDSEFE